MSEHQPIEDWRDVEGCAGYQVSSLGRVRSRRPKNGRGPDVPWRIVDGSPDRRGYRRVSIPYPGRARTVQVHRLVLCAFVGPCPAGMECCHEDGDPANNRLTNLRWGTPKDNAADRRRHGHDRLGEMHERAVLTTEQVRRIHLLSDFPRSCGPLAREFGVPRQAVEHVRYGRTWRSVMDDGRRLHFSVERFQLLTAASRTTPTGLAREAGVDHGFLSAILAGKKSASWMTVCRLAGALGVSAESLCEEKHP